MKRLLVFAMNLLLSMRCLAATPALDIPDEPLGVPGAGDPVNLLLNFAVTVEDAGAAFREPYRATRRYQGYFNPQLCYQYPMKAQAGSVPQPDLDERTGHFAPMGAADARHECRAAFSGNFLNWASMTRLDLLRVALTGGDRVIDEAGITVLQRAWLPDGRVHLDFYASPAHFPRKSIPLGQDSSAPSAVTPFGTDRLFIVSCRNRLLFSNTAEGKDCDSPRVDGAGRRLTSDKFFGEFNARVKVCTQDDAALRPDVCVRYRGAYKPQGALQQAPQRVGVMAYLTEVNGGGGGEYGGALRAPLKLLGPQPAPLDGQRPQGKPEWHADTGILADNPDNKGAVSGAINYINRLGRSNPGRLGAYSRGDPGAELYYEALRYLQGRPSSIAAGASSDDALPIWRTADDPVVSGCQRNIIATIGHPVFGKDRFVPGNTLTQYGDAARPADPFAPGAPFDVMHATRKLGELEAASGAGPRPVLANLDRHGAASFYLAGAAYWAHTNPIRPDKPARVDSHALELGAGTRPPESALYYAAKYGAFDDRNRDGNPNITIGGAADATEWSDGAGTPRHYHAAPGPDDIIPAVRALFGNLGGVLIDGPTAAGGGAGYMIETRYDSGSWSGTVQRRALRAGTDGNLNPAAAASWDAAALLTGTAGVAPDPAPSERKLYTLIRPPGQTERTSPFRWADLPADVRALFDRPDAGAPADGLAAERVGYLRGERTMETGAGGAGAFRRRSSILGDIIGSVPLVVGPPAAGGQGPAFAEFRERGRQRRPAIYVGANDGMLHAFDAATGRELFAYIPNAILPALAQLTSPGYRHRPYVDGSPGQGEAVVRGSWRTVLASGFGQGARGVFALDITDPSAFAAGMGALWEFTERDDPAIGHIRAAPQIARLNVAGKGSAAQYRYFVVVASGINPAAADGKGALFLLSLDKPPGQPWQPGLNYYKFITPAGAATAANALSAPALAIGGDGSARYAYAGDLQGRLWRFDLTGKPPWGGALDRPLFVAHAGSALQPIAHAPALAFAPGGGYLVMFATGRYLERADLRADSFTPQSFYALHDRLQDGESIAGRSALEPRTVSGAGPYRIKGKPVSYSGEAAKAGWYFDFPNTRIDGERAAGSPVVRAGAVLFETLLPGADGCTGPSYRSYLVDVLSGMALGQDGVAQDEAHTGDLASADGTPASVVFSTPLLLEIGTTIGPRHASGTALATRRYVVVRRGTKARDAQARQIQVAFSARRLSWRQVANWKDIHDKVKR